MVCLRWNSIALSLLKDQDLSLLLNYKYQNTSFPHQPRFLNLLQESEQNNSFLHLLVQRWLFYFSKDNINTLKKCPNIEKLDIFFNLPPVNFSRQLSQTRIKQLTLACDHHETSGLASLLRPLYLLETLVLHSIPLEQVFDSFHDHQLLQRLVLDDAIRPLSIQRKKKTNYIRPKATTLSQIPWFFWKRIKVLEIYQATPNTLHTHRYLDELISSVDHLESFVLHIGQGGRLQKIRPGPHSILQKLRERSRVSLKNMSLVNVPSSLL
ncbi:hypothetical protein G6F56_011008 [Rhizopus delemar]|nr:hypothetical protein G6F56_011008 [Rhizopus delemar]